MCSFNCKFAAENKFTSNGTDFNTMKSSSGSPEWSLPLDHVGHPEGSLGLSEKHHSSCRDNLRIWRTGGSALPGSRDTDGSSFSNPYKHCVREELLSQNGLRTGELHEPSHLRVHRNLAGGEQGEARNTASTVSRIQSLTSKRVSWYILKIPMEIDFSQLE